MYYIVAIVLLFAGCSLKEPQVRYFSIENCHLNEWSQRGVYEVELPSYFDGERFVYKKGNELGYLEQKLAHDPQKFLSECAVRELGACLYPWECDERPKELFHIKIEEFYYDVDRRKIVLVAMVNHRRYKIEEPVSKDVMKAALRAYKKLLAQIGR